MTPPEPTQQGDFLSSHRQTEPRSWAPWIIAGAVVVLSLVILALIGRRPGSVPQPGGTGIAAAAPYAAHLPVSGVTMSEATSFSGAKVTYIDGTIANTGNQTVTAVTVQVGFHNDLGQFAARTVMPLSLIRTRDPYIDTESVSAAPIKPGTTREFRLIFDSVPPDWNQQYPEIRLISIQSR